jgi:hypothetical protein
MTETLHELIEPTSAPTNKPWWDGYNRALAVRESLGWGVLPVPQEVASWLNANGVRTSTWPLPSSIDLVATRTEDHRAAIVVNPRAPRIRREIAHATALAHVLFDVTPTMVDGTWEHWPSAARARAFAAMFVMPEDGVRALLAGCESVGVEEVRRVMEHFGTGPHSTTYHLKNLGFIPSDESRIDVLRELAPSN